jgi:lambda family phage portal protein
MFEALRSRLARLIAPRKAGTSVRMYASARPSRLAAGPFAQDSSADSELASSLTTLRANSRALVRDFAYPKRAKRIIQNNVVGGGIGLQAQVKTTREALNGRVNDAIEAAFAEWSAAENCHTGGSLHFADLERLAIGQVFEAGEIFIRKHYRPFGRSRVPFALEVIEPERLAGEFTTPGAADPGNTVRMGVELDPFYRPVAYWIRERHPGELRVGMEHSNRYERVPAENIIHLRIVDRWPQTRGEPWLHAVVRRLQDMDGLSEAEIVAARGAASYMGTIETPDGEPGTLSEKQPDGSHEMTIEPGIVATMPPGSKFVMHTPNRPNTNLDPFLRMMLREIAAGVGTSYESLSRDYSQSNYSSSRLALLDDRDLWRVLQGWLIRNFRAPIHSEFVRQAALARALEAVRVEDYLADPAKFEAARFKPRGWSWIDPTKEVEAYKQAVRNGFTTTEDVIAQTGGGMDLEDVLEGRERELAMMREKGIEFDTDPKRGADGKPAEAKPAAAPPPKPPPPGGDDSEDESDPPRRVVSFGR